MKKRVVIGAAVLLGAATALFLIFRTDRGGGEGVIPLSGNVEVTEVNVAFKIPGRVEALLSDEGKQVAKGDKLALLDRTEYSSQVMQNRASLRNAEAQLEKANKDLERLETLYQKDMIAAQELDSARTIRDVALALKEQAAAAVRISEVRLNDTAIHSPLNGVILRKNSETGETVGAGMPVFTIGDLEHPWIKVYVKEDKLGLVNLGQRAEVRVDSFPEKSYEGTVTFISSEAEFTPKNVQTREERVKLVFGVKVSVKNRNNELKPGMPADVKILLDTGRRSQEPGE